MQKGPLFWAGNHRFHHAHSDTADDVHSPLTGGFWWAHIGWVLEGHREQTDWDQVRDLARYPELRWLDRFHWVPVIAMDMFCLYVAGWSGLVWGAVVSTVLLYHGTFSVNSLGHVFGTRRYATADESRNNWLVAVLTLGEGWHNNHHHYPSAANQGFFWWEIDVTWYILRALRLMGIVWDLRTPPAKTLAAGLVL